MSFLDDYSGVERIDVGHGYWIEIKKCLDRGAQASTERHLEKAVAEVDEETGKTRTRIVPDTSAWRTARVEASIVAWNLDDKDGIWQLSPDSARHRNVLRLPDSVFDQVYRRVDALNKPATQEDTKSPTDLAHGGDPDGPGRPAEPGDLSAEASALVAAGDVAGGIRPAPVA